MNDELYDIIIDCNANNYHGTGKCHYIFQNNKGETTISDEEPTAVEYKDIKYFYNEKGDICVGALYRPIQSMKEIIKLMIINKVLR